jgi:hypothetical protein
MQGPQGDEALQGLDGYDQMVNTFAQNAKAYWRLWGPLGEPMVRIIDAWVEQQRTYLQWLRQNYGLWNGEEALVSIQSETAPYWTRLLYRGLWPSSIMASQASWTSAFFL